MAAAPHFSNLVSLRRRGGIIIVEPPFMGPPLALHNLSMSCRRRPNPKGQPRLKALLERPGDVLL